MKRYLREPGTPFVRRLLAAAPAATSRLSEAEVGSALARRLREGHLTAAQYQTALTALLADVGRFHVVELSPPVVSAVHALLGRHPLRAGDALQLASALALRGELGLGRGFEIVVYDRRLRAAARAEGLRLRPA